MIGLIVLIVVALIVAAFAAAAETALTSVSRLRMRTLADEGSRRAALVNRLHSDPNAYLSTILSLNTVAVIAASSATAVLVSSYYPKLPEAISAVALSLFTLIFCEIAPKSIALRSNERAALALAPIVAVLTTLLRPLIGGLTAFSRLIVRATSRGRRVQGPFVTEEELKMLVHLGEQEGVVEQEERQMIHGILEMTDKAVREVMVPRVDVVAAAASDTPVELITLINDTGHSRIPIYEESIDNVVGVVYAKDLLRNNVCDDDTEPVRQYAREPYFTPETKHVGELLNEMQRKVHIAIVVDEHGGTAGIVTFEDLIEEIVGPIRDEYDVGEKDELQFLSDHEALVNGNFPIDDFRQLLNVDVGEVDSDSVGGLVYERLGEIPKPGARVQIGDVTLIVDDVRRQRIHTIRVESPRAFTVEGGHRNGDLDHTATPTEADAHVYR